MELSLHQQIFDQLGKASRILIALPQNLTADNVGSALALRLFLKKLSKEALIAGSSELPAQLRFLPDSASVAAELGSGQSLMVSLDISQKPLDEISYETSSGKLNIYIKAKDQPFSAEEVSVTEQRQNFDLIIVLDSRSLEDLGVLFERHASLFFDAPKINIDYQAGNEYFGAINLVDINASSVAEVLASLLGSFDRQLIDEDIATALLAAIIQKTNSFQHAQTSPNAFLRASELVSLGGRRQEVVKQLYQTKSLSLLKLWGRALARLKTDDAAGIIFSTINLADFERSGARESDLLGVLGELADNVSSYNLLVLVCEQETGSRFLLAARPSVPLSDIAKKLGAPAPRPISGAYSAAEVSAPDIAFAEAENRLLEAVRELRR